MLTQSGMVDGWLLAALILYWAAPESESQLQIRIFLGLGGRATDPRPARSMSAGKAQARTAEGRRVAAASASPSPAESLPAPDPGGRAWAVAAWTWAHGNMRAAGCWLAGAGCCCCCLLAAGVGFVGSVGSVGVPGVLEAMRAGWVREGQPAPGYGGWMAPGGWLWLCLNGPWTVDRGQWTVDRGPWTMRPVGYGLVCWRMGPPDARPCPGAQGRTSAASPLHTGQRETAHPLALTPTLAAARSPAAQQPAQ